MNESHRSHSQLDESARLFREELQRLGATFIKVGQYLAVRSDLLPRVFCDELMRLVDRAPPLPWGDIRTIILQDLRAEPESLFSTISTQPVCSASFSQTHAARLKNGFEVLVKVKRPTATEEVERDLAEGQLITRLFELANLPPPEFPDLIMEEIRQWLFSQLDFRRELNNLARMHEMALGSPFERIPIAHPAFSSEHVLTTEYLRGVPVSEVLIDLQSTDHSDSITMKLSGIDQNKIADALVSAIFRQIFRYHFLNTDFHPNNLVMISDGAIGFVSFASCEDLTPEVCARQMRYLAAMYGGDTQKIIHALREAFACTEMSAFEADFINEMADEDCSVADLERRGNGTRRSTTGRRVIRTMQLARHHRLKIPRQVCSIHCAMVTAEAVANELAPEATVDVVARQWLLALQLEDGLRTLLPDNIWPMLPGLLALLGVAPRELEDTLSELLESRLTVNTSMSETPDVIRRSNQRASLIGLAILSVGLAFLASSSKLPELIGSTFSHAVMIALACVYVWITIGLIRLGRSAR
jgi:ubiquinone biosynthesis protein